MRKKKQKNITVWAGAAAADCGKHSMSLLHGLSIAFVHLETEEEAPGYTSRLHLQSYKSRHHNRSILHIKSFCVLRASIPSERLLSTDPVTHRWAPTVTPRGHLADVTINNMYWFPVFSQLCNHIRYVGCKHASSEMRASARELPAGVYITYPTTIKSNKGNCTDGI